MLAEKVQLESQKQVQAGHEQGGPAKTRPSRRVARHSGGSKRIASPCCCKLVLHLLADMYLPVLDHTLHAHKDSLMRSIRDI